MQPILHSIHVIDTSFKSKVYEQIDLSALIDEEFKNIKKESEGAQRKIKISVVL